MACSTLHDDTGKPVAIVCGPRTRRRKCSTPGCARPTDLECDAAVERKPVGGVDPCPQRGDARVHKVHGIVFYVWRVVGDYGFDAQVVISTKQPGSRCGGTQQTVSTSEWFAKTSATCDRPVCVRCVVRQGQLDLCAAHGRQQQEAAK